MSRLNPHSSTESPQQNPVHDGGYFRAGFNLACSALWLVTECSATRVVEYVLNGRPSKLYVQQADANSDRSHARHLPDVAGAAQSAASVSGEDKQDGDDDQTGLTPSDALAAIPVGQVGDQYPVDRDDEIIELPARPRDFQQAPSASYLMIFPPPPMAMRLRFTPSEMGALRNVLLSMSGINPTPHVEDTPVGALVRRERQADFEQQADLGELRLAGDEGSAQGRFLEQLFMLMAFMQGQATGAFELTVTTGAGGWVDSHSNAAGSENSDSALVSIFGGGGLMILAGCLMFVLAAYRQFQLRFTHQDDAVHGDVRYLALADAPDDAPVADSVSTGASELTYARNAALLMGWGQFFSAQMLPRHHDVSLVRAVFLPLLTRMLDASQTPRAIDFGKPVDDHAEQVAPSSTAAPSQEAASADTSAPDTPTTSGLLLSLGGLERPAESSHPPTQQAQSGLGDGGSGSVTPRPDDKSKSMAAPGGVNYDAQETAALNQFYKNIVDGKSAGSVTLRSSNNTPFTLTQANASATTGVMARSSGHADSTRISSGERAAKSQEVKVACHQNGESLGTLSVKLDVSYAQQPKPVSVRVENNKHVSDQMALAVLMLARSGCNNLFISALDNSLPKAQQISKIAELQALLGVVTNLKTKGLIPQDFAGAQGDEKLNLVGESGSEPKKTGLNELEAARGALQPREGRSGAPGLRQGVDDDD